MTAALAYDNNFDVSLGAANDNNRLAVRGLSGGVAIPFILACIGFAVFLVGIYNLRLQVE